MADTISQYNHTRSIILGQTLDFDNLKVVLLNATPTFNATHTSLDSVAGAVVDGSRANEVHGNGWTQGGVLIAGGAVTVVNTDEAMLDGTDISIDATGGDIGPAGSAVIIDGTSLKPLWFVQFDSSRTAGVGTPFKFVISANGLYRLTDAA